MSHTLHNAIRKSVGLEIQLEDANLGFMISPLVIILQLKGLTLYTPNLSEEEAKAPSTDRVTVHVPELKLWLERTPCSKHCCAALTIEAIDSSINYVYLEHFSTETNFDRIIKAISRGDDDIEEMQKDISERAAKSAAEEHDDEGADAVTDDIRDSDEAAKGEEREEKEVGRRLLSVRKISLQAPTRVYVRGGGIPLMAPLSLGSVLIDPEALRGHPAALFIWINQRILLAIANSGIDLVAGVGTFALNAVGAGASAVGDEGAAVIEAAGDGVRSVIAGAQGVFGGNDSSSSPGEAAAAANADAAYDAGASADASAAADDDGGKEKGNPLMRGFRSTGRLLLQGIGNTNRALSRSCENVGRVLVPFDCAKGGNHAEDEGDPAASQTQQRR